MTDFSLSETASLVLKAARGAGLSWGLAQEASFAVVWLERRGLPGLAVFAAYCEGRDGGSAGRCPMTRGAYLADSAGRELDDGALRIDDLAAPLLLVPFAARAAEILGNPLAVAWAGAELVVMGERLETTATDGLRADRAETVTVRPSTLSEGDPADLAGRCVIPEAVSRRLDPFVNRTYVPESEASRQRGAGGADV